MASVPLRKPSTPLTVSTTTRVTKTGRTIRYDLTVIQQPERARACGSGAKSSADRRPVDPPPVVELRIFEKMTDKWDDITFAYGANFFLFATLEVARPMAHGRVQQPAAPQVPVLTGMPVSGMAYLDRPAEAGYFIFPDLSVRHEGKYILSFNLYEETSSDQDMKDSKSMGGVMSPDASFDWRLEIKSELFTVYSAKKFPGLAESTSLSRTVAEQGCRVRIRRDVRMRRREGKSNGEMEAQEEEYPRNSRPIEQDPYQARSRSNSGSPDGRAEYQNGQHRSGTLSPLRPNVPGPTDGHLNFGRHENPAPPAQYATPSHFGPPQSQQFAPPQPYYQQNGPPQHSSYAQQPPSVHPGYGGKMYPSSAVEARRDHDVYENPDRRASVASYQPPHPFHHGTIPPVDQSYNRQPFQSYAPSPVMPAQLPPLNLEKLEKRSSIVPRPGPIEPSSFPPLRSPTYERNDRSVPAPFQYSGTPLAPAPAPLTPSLPAEPMRNGNKRPYGSVFNASATEEPLHNGMRPGSSHGDKPVIDEDDEDLDLPVGMTYRRADGRDYQRMVPQAN